MHQLDINETPFVIFIVLSKAFDTIDHDTFFVEYGLDEIACNLLNNYPSDRKTFDLFNECKSDVVYSYWSILGSLLYLYTSNINAR